MGAGEHERRGEGRELRALTGPSGGRAIGKHGKALEAWGRGADGGLGDKHNPILA